jgi:hypothetical protein
MITWCAELARSHESNPSPTVENIHGCSQSDQVGIGLANISRQLYVTVVIAVTALTIDGVSTPPGNFSVMQFALESPAVIGPEPVPPTGPVPPPVGVGVGVGVGVAVGPLDGEGEEVGDDDGLPLDEGSPLGDGLPLGEGSPLEDALPLGEGLALADVPLVGDGLLPGVPLAGDEADGLGSADVPVPAPVPAPVVSRHGPLAAAGELGALATSSESGVTG